MTPRRPSRTAGRRGSRGSGTHPGQSAAPARGRAEREAPEEAAAPVVVERGIPPRVVTLVIVALISFAVVFTSLRAYLSQRAQYDDVVNQLAEAKATSTALERELAQWQDETFVRSQVRQRLGYVMPGETTYVVVGADGLGDGEGGPDAGQDSQRLPWYEALQKSSRAAGGAGQTEAPPDPAQRGWAPTTPQPSGRPDQQPGGAPAPAPTAAPSQAPAPQETP
ncbi:FtsB family cell division protein [Actinomyces bowdenii]|uniref:Septum formation initiator family protein n=1 Tax=Actinomyces bowdenii TaxID=131109 RepID=A0A3P1V6M2_9ACTO|nr:septum formation initiator family protein [Actinomyces bowdenii]RRD29317.1 septum formation initiator family protein [Actinomyces bowdenii]